MITILGKTTSHLFLSYFKVTIGGNYWWMVVKVTKPTCVYVRPRAARLIQLDNTFECSTRVASKLINSSVELVPKYKCKQFKIMPFLNNMDHTEAVPSYWKSMKYMWIRSKIL